MSRVNSDLLSPALRKQRDKLLRDSGFVDIEDPKYAHGQLLHNIRAPADECAQRADYHDACLERLRRPFRSRFQRQCWQAYCDGKTIRETAKLLGSYTKRVHAAIKPLKDEIVRDSRDSPRRKFTRGNISALVEDLWTAKNHVPPHRRAKRGRIPKSYWAQRSD